jgi:hypothetical protein
MERNDFKELLRTIQGSDYCVPEGMKPYDLALEMVSYLGDTDGELRDDLVLSILTQWMIKDSLSQDETRKILDICIDDKHLLYGLGNTDDTVFMRTFSVLVVAVGLYKHTSNCFLSKKEINDILEKVLIFYKEDKDVRGFVQEKGWAHGAAHGADALEELARCQELGYEALKRILHAIYDKTNIDYYGYIHQEDERMVTAVATILERNIIDESEIIEWIKSYENLKKTGKYPEDVVIKVNVKNFLRSLYFRLIDKPGYDNIINETKKVLESINNFR